MTTSEVKLGAWARSSWRGAPVLLTPPLLIQQHTRLVYPTKLLFSHPVISRQLSAHISISVIRTAEMAMDTDAIPNLLGDLRDQAPDDQQEYYIQFEDYWERKLWHELTETLDQYFSKPESAKQRIPLFETFIKSFAKKINQLKLVQLGLGAASEYKGTTETLGYRLSMLTILQMTRSASHSYPTSPSRLTSPLHKTHMPTPR